MKMLLLFIITLVVLLIAIDAVDRSKFRTCNDTGFCRKYRDNKTIGDKYKYELDTSSVLQQDGYIHGKVISSITGDKLNMYITILESGSVRMKITDNSNRWQPSEILMTNGIKLGSYSLLEKDDKRLPLPIKEKLNIANTALLAVAFGKDSVLVVHAAPLKFELYHGDTLSIAANERSMMHYEIKQQDKRELNAIESSSKADKHAGKEIVDYGEDGRAVYADGTREELDDKVDAVSHDGDWGESFGSHRDSMPNGPVSVGMDFSFPYAEHVYGIPEHTTPLSLPTTTIGNAGLAPRYDQPYRLYTLDVFEYELDQTMALYGSIPLMLAHGLVNGKGQTTGVFWFNPSETFIDITDGSNNNKSPYKQTHWISESGEIDFFFLPGPTPTAVYEQYTKLTGTQQLPPIFSLGYHQCRWNYRDEKDVAAVESTFESLDYPVDVIWLDIEHTDGKRYFTWDKSVFPNPIEMQQNVSRHGRRMVTIVDPHIKRDDNYPIHKEATDKGLYIKNKDGADFDGWCWPGSSSYLDFTNERVRNWWAERFSLTRYIGSTMDLFTWNDMNEPSVFNGPEVSMPKDAKNLEGVEHREWHNLYGYYMQWATSMGLVNRSPDSSKDPTLKQRPFVLTRSFWAGSQKYGAMWTGDNSAQWGHLKIAAPMLLSINLGGLSFAGADVGGFFGEPDAELFTRWYQAGAFTPFFRGHAHHDTKRREPWVFGDRYTTILRSVAMTRYSLLPLWYTVFYEAYSVGIPVMRTMFTEFPDDALTFTMDDQWMIGDTLLVKPVTDSGKNSVDVYLPGNDQWFDFVTLKSFTPSKSKLVIDAPLEKIPVFIRGGKILSRKMRLRRSSKLMFFDPYTLTITPDAKGNASGKLYMDDEISLAHESHKFYSYRQFTYENNLITCSAVIEDNKQSNHYEPTNTVERIEIAGQQKAPSSVSLKTIDPINGDKVIELQSFYDNARKVITIKKPDVMVAKDWVIELSY